MTQYVSASISSKRAPRIPRNAARRRLLDAALDQVRDHGLSVGFEGMQLDDVASHAEVSRSAIYRLWGSKSAFVEDLLVDVAHFGSANLCDDQALPMSLALVAAHPRLLSDQGGRRRLLLEVVRTVLEHNYYHTIDSIPWQTFLSLSATVLGPLPSGLRHRIEDALSEGSAEFIANMAIHYEKMCCLLGFQLRDQFDGGYHLFATLASSIVEGLAIRHLSVPSMTDNFYEGESTVLNAAEKWAPAAIGFLALFDTFMEPDPTFDSRSMAKQLREASRE